MRTDGFEHRTQGRSLLIVEDDADIREALHGLLQMEGYAVEECKNGLEALQRLRRKSPPPDVILLDLMMPVMDGWQFRVEQKRDPHLASIPVVALSADSTPKAAAIDAEAYLRKPVDYDTLVDTIDRLVLKLEHKELQSKLAQHDRLASLGTLAAGVAHEINNPLAYVLLNLTFLQEHLPSLVDALDRGARPANLEQRKQELFVAIAHARDGAERIRGTVKGLKTFSRPEDESLSPVDVRHVMDSSIGMVMNELRHRAKLVKDYSDVPTVLANEARLGQVFLNLLLNAVQSLPGGASGGKQEIRVVVKPVDERVVVEVRDTGQGIPADIRGRIFEPFFTTKPIGVGTGLGLAICHGIVTALGGNLVVESEVGKGSVFRVDLPAKTRAQPVPRPKQANGPALPRGRILVIDDEPIICFTIERLLSADHDVTALTSAEDALTRIERGERYEVILCDLMMPEMDGAELYERLRAKYPDQAARMVFVTGGAFTPRGQELLARVPNPRVEKPFDVESLLRLIRDQLVRAPALEMA